MNAAAKIEVIRRGAQTIYRSDYTTERVIVQKMESTSRLGQNLVGRNRWHATCLDGTVIAVVETAAAAKASALSFMKRRVA